MKKLEELGEGDVPFPGRQHSHLLCRMTCMNRSWQGWMEKGVMIVVDATKRSSGQCPEISSIPL